MLMNGLTAYFNNVLLPCQLLPRVQPVCVLGQTLFACSYYKRVSKGGCSCFRWVRCNRHARRPDGALLWWFMLGLCPGRQCFRVHCKPLEGLGTVGPHLHARPCVCNISLCTCLYTCQNCAAIKKDEQHTATDRAYAMFCSNMCAVWSAVHKLRKG